MKTTLVALLAGLAVGASPAVSRAEPQEQILVAIPESHQLVEIQPGVQVIPRFELEVFFTAGAYWLRTDGVWYLARHPAASATFTLAEQRAVPAALAKLPVGSHLHYQAAAGQKVSTKALPSTDSSDAEVDIGSAKMEPPAARPAAAPPAKAAPAKAPPKKPAAPAKAAPKKPAAPAKPPPKK